MAHVKTKQMQVLKDTADILRKHGRPVSKEDKAKIEEFCKVVEDIDEKNKAVMEHAKQYIREYRSTPEGYEKSKKSRRESAARARARKKLEKEGVNS